MGVWRDGSGTWNGVENERERRSRTRGGETTTDYTRRLDKADLKLTHGGNTLIAGRADCCVVISRPAAT